ncbi:hypothetical protein [Apilactobacillus timberlakei]|uniref:DUF2975 domain-containing protein n=2 Tax=Apilactobacillus timberlakei TaxID=2008380 RepID=A0ABY2YS44_9LACO|nr:hypothetical protein [Apilactobacillus timberlakei]TPR13485.1 hypothetical protein DY048_06170 [Apilactobacillus timberlakei]TPR15558.1 hypothetical protein DY052_05455 [Apilactobacillus timberlakei]
MKSKLLFKKINQQNLFICLLIIAFICFSNIIFGGGSKDIFLKILNSLSGCVGLCFIVLLSRNYGNFKLSIQNGMSRKQFFKSNMFGSLMSLFNRMVKLYIYLLLISLTVSFFIGIAHEGFYEYFVRIMDNLHVVSIFKFISGFNTIDIDQRHSLANANPINAILTLLISSSILSCISYKITKLQQVNR